MLGGWALRATLPCLIQRNTDPRNISLSAFVFPVNSMVEFHVWLGLILLGSQLVLPVRILLIKYKFMLIICTRHTL